jgi:outer membrane biosynthesis protein TonB
MKPIELTILNDGSFVLQGKGSELLILAEHTHELRSRKVPKEFAAYFMSEALVNRPARKMFESWLRKDSELWRKIFKAVHEELSEDQATQAEQRWKAIEEQVEEAEKEEELVKPTKKAEVKAPVKEPTTSTKKETKKKPEAKAKPVKKTAKKTEKKPAKAKPAKKAEPKKTEKKAVKKKKA